MLLRKITSRSGRLVAPHENVWQFMGDDWLLSNRVFDTTDALLDHCCDGWNKLEAQPWTVMSLGLRDWIHRFKSLRYNYKDARVRVMPAWYRGAIV
jgi:hypothetical protein